MALTRTRGGWVAWGQERYREEFGRAVHMCRKDRGRIKLFIKGLALVSCLVFAALYPEGVIGFFSYQILLFKVYHLIWLATLAVLVKRLIPGWNSKISVGKIFERHYAQASAEGPSRQEKLSRYRRKMNIGAFRTAVYWSIIVLITGLFYNVGIFNKLWLFLSVAFFIFMDQFCVSVWCPFQWIIGNKCCNACRINNWGYLMAFSPLIFVPSLWTISIVALSGIVVIQWEYLFHKYPERFYELYNANLQCKNCGRGCKLSQQQSS
ncbi:hypothetical protein [Syntrophorhabdus aromaticivorans]|nr:hypothetical protein [Syntrophorhabdus aromaticivorans]